MLSPVQLVDTPHLEGCIDTAFKPAALQDSYKKNQWCRTGSLPEYQKSFHLMSMEKCQDEEDGNGGANVNWS